MLVVVIVAMGMIVIMIVRMTMVVILAVTVIRVSGVPRVGFLAGIKGSDLHGRKSELVLHRA